MRTPDPYRRFGLITGTIVATLFGLLFPWLFGRAFPLWPWIVMGILWVWALVMPKSLRPVYRVWMTIGHALGWVNSRIILGLMFYVMILPIGLIMRLLGRDPMFRRFDKKALTYRISSKNQLKDHVERPF